MSAVNNRRARALTALTALLLICAISAAPPKPAPGTSMQYSDPRAEIIVRDVPYVPTMPDNPKLRLDIYSNPHDEPWPTLVMIHGGGWVKGTKDYENKVWNCKVAANHGYVVFSIDYRLVPEVSIKEQAEDAMAAVIWVKQHAKEYGGDPERIGVMGGSAGGHLALLVAWASDDPYFHPTGYDGPLDSDVRAAAVYYPVVDVDATLIKNGARFLGPLAHLLFYRKLGRQFREMDDHLSPIHHLDENCVPTLFLTGDADELGLYPQSVDAVNKLKVMGVDAELFTAHGMKHGFTWYWNDPQAIESSIAVVKWFDKYLK